MALIFLVIQICGLDISHWGLVYVCEFSHNFNVCLYREFFRLNLICMHPVVVWGTITSNLDILWFCCIFDPFLFIFYLDCLTIILSSGLWVELCLKDESMFLLILSIYFCLLLLLQLGLCNWYLCGCLV